ncbi:MAG: Q-cell neuroblast polarization [Candidatus Sumerlaeota bacterium]|nr:Q-cell neuroblast polarization [Candidatus Sumerlaeota bacterium]
MLARHGASLGTGIDIFPSEAAIQYSMAREIAEGRPIPARDFRLQWPEGISTRRDMTLGIEYVAGWSARLARALGITLPFPYWAVLVAALLSMLTAVPVFLLARTLVERGGNTAGLVAAALWTLHPLASLRVIGNFGRENLALPFLFLGSWGVMGLLREGEREEDPGFRRLAGPALAAVLGFGGALAFWHLSRTVVTIEFGLLWLLCLGTGLPRRTWVAIGGTALALGLFSLVHPVLRTRGFAFSPGLVLGLGLLAGGAAPGWALIRRRVVAGCSGGGGALAALLVGSSGDSHVSAVLVAKARHLLHAPSDPSALPFEARALWLEAFNSPGPAAWLYYVGPVAAAILGAAVLFGFRRMRERTLAAPCRLYFAAQFLLYGLAFAFFFRLHSLWIVWLTAGMGALLTGLWARHRRSAVALGVIAASIFLAQTVAGPTNALYQTVRRLDGRPLPVYVTHRQSRLDLIDWARRHTKPDAVFAGHIGTMAILYTDAGRAVVLQPKWENDTIRGKVQEWTRAMFADEAALATFCRAYGAEYLVFEPRFALEEGPGSLAYQAGQRAPEADDPAVLLNFQPLEFLDFELVYRNPHFQVYRFLPTPETPLANVAVDYEPIYDPDFFASAWVPGKHWDPEAARGTASQVESWYAALAMAQNLRQSGKEEMARALLSEIVRQCPGFHRAWALLGEIAAESGDAETARAAFERARLYGPATANVASQGEDGLDLNQ